jgi:hypothetical protein
VLVVRSRPLRPTRAGQLLLKHASSCACCGPIWRATCDPGAPDGRLRRRGGPWRSPSMPTALPPGPWRR